MYPLVVSLGLIAVIMAIAIYYRQKDYEENDPVLFKLREDLIKVDPRAENLEFYIGSESYTEDKERIYICMKDKDGEYYPYNTLLNVGLHELAHAFSQTIDKDHVGEEFNSLYIELRNKAESLGLFNPNIPVQSDYCSK